LFQFTMFQASGVWTAWCLAACCLVVGQVDMDTSLG
jgi:hypothetical protein